MVRTKQTHRITHKNAAILKKLKNRLIHNKKKQHVQKEVARKPRRWHPGTVAKREIRKLSRSTNLLFPKISFNRLVREVCQNVCSNDKSFTSNSILAIQEAAEVYVTETFHKANMARMHAGRETLGVKDIRFSRFMTPESMWIVPAERIWDPNSFGSSAAEKASHKSKASADVFNTLDKVLTKKHKKKKRAAEEPSSQAQEEEEKKEEGGEEEMPIDTDAEE